MLTRYSTEGVSEFYHGSSLRSTTRGGMWARHDEAFEKIEALEAELGQAIKELGKWAELCGKYEATINRMREIMADCGGGDIAIMDALGRIREELK